MGGGGGGGELLFYLQNAASVQSGAGEGSCSSSAAVHRHVNSALVLFTSVHLHGEAAPDF